MVLRPVAVVFAHRLLIRTRGEHADDADAVGEHGLGRLGAVLAGLLELDGMALP